VKIAINRIDSGEIITKYLTEDVDFCPNEKDPAIIQVKDFVTKKLCNFDYLRAFNLDKLLIEYVYLLETNEAVDMVLSLDDVLSAYNEGIILSEAEDPIPEEYDEKDLLANGFLKSTFVIHQHNSKTAPTHWDLRFKSEFGKSAYSFVLINQRLPEAGQKLFVKRQPMHPAVWVDIKQTEIESGYGKGSVITVDRGPIYYKERNENFTFYLKGSTARGAYHLIKIGSNNYLLVKAKNSIISTKDQRLDEWKKYADNFLKFINLKIGSVYGLKTSFVFGNPDNKDDKNNIIFYEMDLAEKVKDEIISTKHKKTNINKLEDILRKNILDQIGHKILKHWINENQYRKILNLVKAMDYDSPSMEKMKDYKMSEESFLENKFIQMWSDIYLGHKYYMVDNQAVDFEKLLIRILKEDKD
jgi:hypothetical protein